MADNNNNNNERGGFRGDRGGRPRGRGRGGRGRGGFGGGFDFPPVGQSPGPYNQYGQLSGPQGQGYPGSGNAGVYGFGRGAPHGFAPMVPAGQSATIPMVDKMTFEFGLDEEGKATGVDAKGEDLAGREREVWKGMAN